MGESISSLRLVLKSLSDRKPWIRDPGVINVPWRSDNQFPSPLVGSKKQPSFGVMRTDGVVSPHPPVARALRIVIEAIEAAGYEVRSQRKSFQH